MNLYQKALRWAGTKRWFALVGRYVLTPIDKRFRDRSVSLSTFGTDFPMGYLTTVGRRSGQARTVPLLYVVPAGAVAAVVGTNFGGPQHPQWVANLGAQPQAVWRVDEDIEVTARVTAPVEHRALWTQFVAVWPGYEEYVARSQREPMMFILERR
jgi:deazaflavin-dependent oxidoreductase (nitroreductase family)